MSSSGLFDEFPEVSAKQWKQKIQFDLKGADYNDTLVWESNEGIKVKPFYHAEDLQNLETPSVTSTFSWKIAQTIYAGDAKKANSKAIYALQRGAESLHFIIPEEFKDYASLLSQIDLESTPLHFNFQFLDSGSIKSLLNHTNGKKASIHLHLDPIGNLARTGNWHYNLRKDHQLLEDISLSASKSNSCASLGVDLSLYQNAGANMVQQLAYSLGQASEYLNHLEEVNTIEKMLAITFKVSVGGNYFFEIAKIRALRLLWNTLSGAFGLESDCHILAFPSKRNKTIYDYNVNMLRTTSECMSAVLGGADTVANLPYDIIYHKDNEFGERISRNQLLLLKNEAYLSHAAQAASGTYYIETLTQQLAEKAWSLFKQIEHSGGFLSELKKGNIQRKVKESSGKEQTQFNAGEITLLGTNKYQNSQDRMKDDLELYPFVKTQPRKTLLEPILEKRLAEELEQKRLDDEQKGL